MENERKKKHRKGKRKINSTDSSFEEKQKNKKISKSKVISLQKEFTKKRISVHSSNFIPAQVCELDNIINTENNPKKKEDNYFEITDKNRKKLKDINDIIDEQNIQRKNIFDFLRQIEIYKNQEDKICMKRINEIPKEIEKIDMLKNYLIKFKNDFEKSETEKKMKIMILENKDTTKRHQIILKRQELEKETNTLSDKTNENNKMKEKIPELIQNISKLDEEINEQKILMKGLIEKKNKLKEEYSKINKIAINDNKFCHQNFFALLPLFPYYKNVAFISREINNENCNNITKINEAIDENKIITDEQLIDDIENEDIKNIKFLLKQKEESDKNINYKILNDRRTLQYNNKEKYKFSKIFSIINNNYIAEPWNLFKYSSLKLSTINSYFDEFNMTAINNNYFIIYFVPVLDKSCLKGELYSLYQQIKNNEYIDKYMTIKISAITESNYINLQNINQEKSIKTQIETINNSEMNMIHGFLYEFIKLNRLNKKNIFRIYNLDYSYPQAIEMMNNITKYYAKKKRKKTGVYKKVIKGVQPKAKKKQADKSINNDNKNNKLNKGNIKNNQGNKKNNNMNKVVQFKKSVIFNNSHKDKTISTNNAANNLNKTFISNNKSKKKNDNKKILNVSSIDNKKIIKKSGSSQKVQNKKEKNVTINSKNNIKIVKIDEKPKSITPKKNNSSEKELTRKTLNINNIIINDLKVIKPEHTLIIHDINDEFANSIEFKKVVKSCGLLNINDK